MTSRPAAMRSLRYAVVGALAFVVDFGCLLAFEPRMPLLLANTLAFLLANLLNFLLGHVWVFARPLRGPGVGRQYAGVLVVSLIGLALNDAIVWVGVVMAGVGLIPAKVLATIAAWTWNFQARSRWIYAEERA